ncbi:DUF11 domain-containing protein [Nostoc sp. TCL26-01]|uniref:DUF11 domain-containing protein n=1 Tax=Nostoc sp. TCL26-01 TaxID=2576904 RepID=UPI0015C098DA|nr:DUF11 domain-containing protein [Nostoc sp. TCL26-01]QLE55415.1 DUF11 domain-containing protein [Nostoc sp. TCL26-01]
MKYLFNYLKAIATVNLDETVGNLTKKTMLKSLSNNRKKIYLSSFACLFYILAQDIKPSWAEGSKQLVADGGDRPYLEWLDPNAYTTAGIVRQNKLKVYVETGETVYLGSSVFNANNNLVDPDIIYRSPFNGQNGNCNVLKVANVVNGDFGHIDTIDKEKLGPAPLAAGGYNPCSFVATETGIYEVEFRSARPLTNPRGDVNPPPISATSQFATNEEQRGGIAAWDVTVAKNGVAQPGRLFTNYIALNLGNNGRSLKSKLYIQTKDGYRYQTDMNGVDPFGFLFFANSRGFIDQNNNSTLYRSANSPANSLSTLDFSGNVRVQRPDIADTTTDITHLVFFNRPATATLNALGIPLTPITPPIPSNFIFTGGTGGSGNQTYIGVGGKFSFNVGSSGSYQIIIDTNNDGIFDPSLDRVLQNPMLSGFNVVSWDGKDAAGVNLQPLPNNAAYSAQITTRVGEYHFPLLDAENNPSGFRITMENPPAAFPPLKDLNNNNIGASTIYYNDSNYSTKNGTTTVEVKLDGTGATNPRNAARGINSASGKHEFSQDYGDYKGIDTWTYFPSQAVITPLVITTDKQANVKGTKSVRFSIDNDGAGTVNVGDSVEYTITYSNLTPDGNTNAINFIINDTLPSQLTFVSAAITSATSGNNITLNPSYSGSGALTNSGTLRVGDTITMKITAKINNANGGNPISNQANANFTTADSAGTVGTVYTDADSAGASSNPPTVGNSFAQTADDGTNIGNDPSKTNDDDPTLLTVSTVVPNPPKLVLVKRITRINNQDLTNNVNGSSAVAITAANYVAAPRDVDDDDPKWPANYLRGMINAGNVKPGDDLEYTIYFLSSGQSNANNVKLCDLIPANTTFISTAFNGLSPNDGVSGADQGIALAVGATNPTVYFSNAADSDRATFYPANSPTTPSFCPNSNTNGAIAVEITRATVFPNIPPASSSGTPTSSYGFVRFRVKVK